MDSPKSIITGRAKSSCALDPFKSCRNAKAADYMIHAFNIAADKMPKHFTQTFRDMVTILTKEYFYTALELDATLNELEKSEKREAYLAKKVKELTAELEAHVAEEYEDAYEWPVGP